MKGQELASKVSISKPYTVSNKNEKYKVAVIDLGAKKSIIDNLVDRGCEVHVFPYNTSSETILACKPNGILVSNGPGDPEPLTEVISNVKKLIDMKLPVFGICLGHQIIGLSQGLKTYKMHNGHRGINHPVKNIIGLWTLVGKWFVILP